MIVSKAGQDNSILLAAWVLDSTGIIDGRRDIDDSG
jgi:hypothetical protein